MTSKEALENIKDNYPLVHPTNYKLIKKSYDTLEELVERDTPIKVIKEVDKKYIDTYDFYERNIYRCGSCKKVLIVDRAQILEDNEKTSYCHYCGQRLDWSE